MPSIKITYLNTQLKKLRDFVEGTLVPLRVDPVHINLVVVAVEEICCNAIEHSDHQQDHSKDFIHVTIRPHLEGSTARVDIEIKDSNKNHFNLANYDMPDISTIVQHRCNGGIGLILFKKIAENINFKREAEQNICNFSTRVPIEGVRGCESTSLPHS
ncbi:MAG: ATP-binding protein [Cytophagales bacterium]|nr:MAG: ATP-binding protein [Cytophagales bacterium]TAF61093.1 MAG: ATP-binding protein [Cytophagales bacterium]